MADTIITVGGETTLLEKNIRAALSKNFKLTGFDARSFTQPLGKIKGQLGEFEKSLEASNARVVAFGASAGSIYLLTDAFKSMVRSTVEVEKTLADINTILNVSERDIKSFGDTLFNVANKTSQSFQTTAEAALEFSRQGLTLEQTAKRTADALTLAKLSGLSAAASVEALTAAINSFSDAGLTTAQIVNKLAAVDARYAVSSADLAEAIKRVGSSASEAGVNLDQLIALVTSAQQTTARGGAVIGNSFKTIFTRLQRPKVLDDLKDLGINTTNAYGQTLPLVQILTQLAKTFDNLGDAQKSQVAELVGGVYQINILKAVLGDLTKGYSTYNGALRASSGASNEAEQRIGKLAETIDSQVNRITNNLKRAGSVIGDLTIAPALQSVLSKANTVLETFALGKQPESLGEKAATGFLKGLGSFIAGPGLIIAAVGAFKIFTRLASFVSDAGKTVLGLGQAAQQQAQIQAQILQLLQKNPQLYAQIESGAVSVQSAAQAYLNIVNATNLALERQKNITSQIAASAIVGGATISSKGTVSVKKGKTAAGGFIPQSAAMAESFGAMAGGYKPGKVVKSPVGGVMNTAEDVKYVPGFSQPFINPPKNSKAGRAHRQNSIGKTGIDPYMATGFVPNFALDPRFVKAMSNYLGSFKYGKIKKSSDSTKLQERFAAGRVFDNTIAIASGLKQKYSEDTSILDYFPISFSDESIKKKLGIATKTTWGDAKLSESPINLDSYVSKIIRSNFATVNKISDVSWSVDPTREGGSIILPQSGANVDKSITHKTNKKALIAKNKSIENKLAGIGDNDVISSNLFLDRTNVPLRETFVPKGSTKSQTAEKLAKAYSFSGFIPNFAEGDGSLSLEDYMVSKYGAIQPLNSLGGAALNAAYKKGVSLNEIREKMVPISNKWETWTPGGAAKAQTEGRAEARKKAQVNRANKYGYRKIILPWSKTVADFGGDPNDFGDAYENLVAQKFGAKRGERFKRANDYPGIAGRNPQSKYNYTDVDFIVPKNPNDLSLGGSLIEARGGDKKNYNASDISKKFDNFFKNNPSFDSSKWNRILVSRNSDGFIPNFAGKEISTKFFRTKTGFGEPFSKEGGTGLSGTVYRQPGFKSYGYQLKEQLNNMVMSILGNNVFIPDTSYLNPRLTNDVNAYAENSARVAALRLSSGGKTKSLGMERGMMSEAFGNSRYVFNPNAVYTGQVSGRMKRVNYDRLSDVLGVFWSSNPETKSAWEDLKSLSESGKYEDKEKIRPKTALLKKAYNDWLAKNKYVGTRVKLSDYRQGAEGVRGANYAALRSDLAGVSNVQNLGEIEKLEKYKTQGLFYGDYKNNKAAYDKLGRWNYDAATKKMFLKHGGFVPNFADVGVLTGDSLKGGAYKEALQYLAETNKPVNTIVGPAGSGKTTRAVSQYGGEIMTGTDFAKYNSFVFDRAGFDVPQKDVVSAENIRKIISKSNAIDILIGSRNTIKTAREQRVSQGDLNIPGRTGLQGGNKGIRGFTKAVREFAKNNPQSRILKMMRNSDGTFSHQQIGALKSSLGFVPNFASMISSTIKGKGNISAIKTGKNNYEIEGVEVGQKFRGQGLGSQLYKNVAEKIGSGNIIKSVLLPQEKALSDYADGKPVSAKAIFPQLSWAKTAKSSKLLVNGKEVAMIDFENGIASRKYNASKLDSALIELVNTHSSGFVPNFSPALKNAVDREMDAGYSKSQIRIGKSSSLVSNFNPEGLGVYNSTEGNLGKGMQLAKQAGINPKTKGMSSGFVPNFASKRNKERRRERARAEAEAAQPSPALRLVPKETQYTGEQIIPDGPKLKLAPIFSKEDLMTQKINEAQQKLLQNRKELAKRWSVTVKEQLATIDTGKQSVFFGKTENEEDRLTALGKALNRREKKLAKETAAKAKEGKESPATTPTAPESEKKKDVTDKTQKSPFGGLGKALIFSSLLNQIPSQLESFGLIKPDSAASESLNKFTDSLSTLNTVAGLAEEYGPSLKKYGEKLGPKFTGALSKIPGAGKVAGGVGKVGSKIGGVLGKLPGAGRIASFAAGSGGFGGALAGAGRVVAGPVGLAATAVGLAGREAIDYFGAPGGFGTKQMGEEEEKAAQNLERYKTEIGKSISSYSSAASSKYGFGNEDFGNVRKEAVGNIIDTLGGIQKVQDLVKKVGQGGGKGSSEALTKKIFESLQATQPELAGLIDATDPEKLKMAKDLTAGLMTEVRKFEQFKTVQAILKNTATIMTTLSANASKMLAIYKKVSDQEILRGQQLKKSFAGGIEGYDDPSNTVDSITKIKQSLMTLNDPRLLGNTIERGRASKRIMERTSELGIDLPPDFRDKLSRNIDRGLNDFQYQTMRQLSREIGMFRGDAGIGQGILRSTQAMSQLAAKSNQSIPQYILSRDEKMGGLGYVTPDEKIALTMSQKTLNGYIETNKKIETAFSKLETLAQGVINGQVQLQEFIATSQSVDNLARQVNTKSSPQAQADIADKLNTVFAGLEEKINKIKENPKINVPDVKGNVTIDLSEDAKKFLKVKEAIELKPTTKKDLEDRPLQADAFNANSNNGGLSGESFGF